MYCHDARGLGHTARSLSIASYISQKIDRCTILLLTDLSIVGKFKIPSNVDYVHLPGVIYEKQDEFRPKNLNIRAKKVLRLRCKIAQSAAKTFKPQVMVIDRDPLQMPKEMKRNLGFMREVMPKTQLIWSLPDVLGDPQMITQAWEQGKAYKTLHHYTDEIWIYGAKEIFDATEQYKFPETLRKKTLFTGYFKAPALPAQQKPKDLTDLHLEKPFVVVTAGSGVRGSRLIETYMKLLSSAGDHFPFQSVVITGPMMHSRKKGELRERAASLPNVIFHRYSKHILQYIKYADLVISNGGYNTLCEILSYNKKAILIPDAEPPQEHLLRAQIFHQLGYVDLLPMNQLTVEKLGEKISALLPGPAALPFRKMNSEIPMNGLDRIVERLNQISEKPNLKIKKNAI
ncbi:MAG: hypothetical protein D6814_07935 [Calditrichaeota bacterium]|nr:MAG: hypothetical protein D6814_07935 [Calditrichota bacterium]